MNFKIHQTEIDDVLIFEPTVFEDSRGFFYESFNYKEFCSIVGNQYEFKQDNHSMSGIGVIRGLHYQLNHPQGKLIRVVKGKIFDVVVDLRLKSRTFGRWLSFELSSENRCQIWIPPGFAHGFMSLCDCTEIIYKTTDYWCPDDEHCLLWNDPSIGIKWPTGLQIVLSEKDRHGQLLSACDIACPS